MTTFDEYCWLGRRVGVVALVVGEFWNGASPAEQGAVYAILLGLVLLAERALTTGGHHA